MTSRGQRPEKREHVSGGQSDVGAVRHSRRLTLLIAGLTVVVAIIDQLSKVLALDRLETSAPTIWFLGELLGWKLLFNPGAALSIGTGMTWVLTLVAVAVVIVVARLSRRIDSTGWAVAFGLLLGGACGNLIDRFFREPGFASGHVVDFINYGGFFVGNVADIAIVLAAVLIIWFSIRGVTIATVPEVVTSETDTAAEADQAVDSGTGAPGDEPAVDSRESSEQDHK